MIGFRVHAARGQRRYRRILPALTLALLLLPGAASGRTLNANAHAGPLPGRVAPYAAGAGWTISSPFGDDTTAVAASPAYASDHTVFMGIAYNNNAGQPYGNATAAILRSTDSGTSWTVVWSHQTPTDSSSMKALVTQIVVSPAFATDGAVFALWNVETDGGIVRSSDGGRSFQEADSSLPLADIRNGSEARGLAISPQYGSDKTIAVTLDATTAPSYLSTDGGTTWNTVTVTGAGTGGCAGTTITGGGFVTPLGGTKLASYLPAGNIICNNNQDLRYASSQDGGRTWAASGDIQSAIQNSTTSNNMDSQHSHLDATSDGTNLMYTDEYGNAVHSGDGGQTWQNVLMPVLGSYVPAANASGHPPLALDIPPGGHDIYAVPMWGKGAPHLYHSADGGAAWSLTWAGHGTTSEHDVAVAGPATFFYAAGPEGMFRSTGGGATWQSVGLTHPQVSAVAVSPAFAADHGVFGVDFVSGLATQTGQEANGRGMFRSETGGATWHEPEAADPMAGAIWTTPIKGGLSLAVSPAYASDHTVFEGDVIGAVNISTDGGASWTTSLINNQEGWYINALAVSPHFATDHAVYAALGNQGFGIARSNDGGLTWGSGVPADRQGEIADAATADVEVASDPSGLLDVAIAVGGQLYLAQDNPTSATIPEWSAIGQRLGGGGAVNVAFSPNYATDCTIYVASGYNTLDDGLYVSTNACPANALAGTVTWTQLKNGLPARDITHIVLSPTFAADRTLFVSSLTQGVYASTDAGSSWSLFNAGLGNLTVHHLALAPTGNQTGVLFAATEDGVWQANVALVPAAPTVTPIPPTNTAPAPTSTMTPPPPAPTNTITPPPTNTQAPPPPAPTNTTAPPLPPAPRATNTPTNTPTRQSTATSGAPTQSTGGAGSPTATTPSTSSPPRAPASLHKQSGRSLAPSLIMRAPRTVANGSMLAVSVHTTAHTSVSATLQVTTRRLVVQGKGKRRKRTVQTVTLYTVRRTVQTNGRGDLIIRLPISYKALRPVTAQLEVITGASHHRMTQTTTVTIRPQIHNTRRVTHKHGKH